MSFLSPWDWATETLEISAVDKAHLQCHTSWGLVHSMSTGSVWVDQLAFRVSAAISRSPMVMEC